ncbi:hypothetical protein HII31_03354 [Pseudocercospora fuligena]|uniref:DUF6536 domain-containing protein n=1 Tax=Pseudocercospora fuligena TaxID=685502 RepID=A0A8H6VM79_9PEZI|nr:hypothetical protein HII31_03354 [Pseudocercospora fuligena]
MKAESEALDSLLGSPRHSQGFFSFFAKGSWRTTVRLGALLGTATLVLNTLILAWALKTFEVIDGAATIYNESCEGSDKIAAYTHFAINIVSTLLLSASNNCSQLRSAPTRKDVERAHAKGDWLDVGVQSVRNLRTIPFYRTALWLTLLGSSIPLHLLHMRIKLFWDVSYNSVIFETQAAQVYKSALVTNDFANGASWNHTSWNASSTAFLKGCQSNITSLERLENSECLKKYGTNDINLSRGNVLAVTSYTQNDSVVEVWSPELKKFDWTGSDWVCHGSTSRSKDICDIPNLVQNEQQWAITIFNTSCKALNASACRVTQQVYDAGNITYKGSAIYRNTTHYGCADPPYCVNDYATGLNLSSGVASNFGSCTDPPYCINSGCCKYANAQIDYCLMEPSPARCTVQISTRILLTVIVCNVVKVIAMITTLRTSFQPLATLGDALASFLEHKDAATAEKGPVSLREIEKSDRPLYEHESPRLFISKALRWEHGVSNIRWRQCWAACALALIVTGILMGVTIKMSDGALNSSNNLLGTTTNNSLEWNALMTNMPQLVISTVYLLYNNALTCMLLAREYAQYAIERKSLRVSIPVGSQRSTYWLQVPYKFILPLMTTMAVLHWLVSRSLYLVQLKVYDSMGNFTGDSSISSLGYSPLFIILSVAVGSVLLSAIMWLSRCKLGSNMPVVGSCSLAISAACANNLEVDAATKSLMYGVLRRAPGKAGTRYVGFSAEEVDVLQDRTEYL